MDHTDWHVTHLFRNEFVTKNLQYHRLTGPPVDRGTPVTTAFTGSHVDSYHLGRMRADEFTDCTEHVTESYTQGNWVIVTAGLTPYLYTQ